MLATIARRALFSLLLLGFGSSFAFAQTPACEWHRGRCYQPMQPRLSEAQAASLRNPKTLPDEPLQLVTHHLDPSAGAAAAPMQLPPLVDPSAETGSVSATKTSFTTITEPWDDAVHRKVVKLYMSFPNQYGYACSGTIVGSRTVLTAGHCVYSHDEGGYATSIEVKPAMYGAGRTPYGEYTVEDITTTNWWVDSEEYRGDIAVVLLNERAGDLTGSLPAYEGGGSPLDGDAITYLGYPGGERLRRQHDGLGLHGRGRRVDVLALSRPELIRAMSGGPATSYVSGATQVVGVNSYCAGGGWYGSECCHVAGGSLVGDMIDDFESVSTPAPTSYWTCPISQYSGSDGCHCACGAYDPDCGDSTAAVYGCDDVAGQCAEGYCDFNGNCRTRDVGGACDDGDPCTVSDYCINGTCRGSESDCDDGNPCTEDSCHATLGCRHDALTGACDDGDPCTLGDTCQDGVCGGTERDCDDGNICTTDYCSATEGCKNVSNSEVCDDGDACTVNDYCRAGACTGARLGCDDGSNCTTDDCDPDVGCVYTPTTYYCDDGSACTFGDQCSEGRCVGNAINCDDGDPCTADSCDPASGCVHTDDPTCSDQVDPTPVPDVGDPITGAPDAGSTEQPGADTGSANLPPDEGSSSSCQAGGHANPAGLALLLLLVGLVVWRAQGTAGFSPLIWVPGFSPAGYRRSSNTIPKPSPVKGAAPSCAKGA